MQSQPNLSDLTALPFVEAVELEGHLIDSLILPKVLDLITSSGGAFRIAQIAIGQGRNDSSRAVLEVRAPTREALSELVARLTDHGAVPLVMHNCTTLPADLEGAFPEGFYSTTNQRTEVRVDGVWHEVADQEMDCGILVEHAGGRPQPRCLPMTEVRLGDRIVVGHAGVRVFPEQRAVDRQLFEFMGSAVSTEKPKGVAIREVARELLRARATGGKTLLVGGPAIVHSGSVKHVCELLRSGCFDVLFAGNALATHDIEQSLYGTSLGVDLEHGMPQEAGHEHHLRAINTIRRAGGIARAVELGVLQSGILFECVQRGIPFLLAGSIRDDGPLPDVITDTLVAQREMRQLVRGVTFCLMVATTLHSVATGNLLPAWVKTVCVDINPSAVIKLSDRGSFQSVGIVTDVEPFFRALVHEITAQLSAPIAEIA